MRNYVGHLGPLHIGRLNFRNGEQHYRWLSERVVLSGAVSYTSSLSSGVRTQREDTQIGTLVGINFGMLGLPAFGSNA